MECRQKLVETFAPLFAGGLMHVDVFCPNGATSVRDLCDEMVNVQRAISEGRFRVVRSLDGGLRTEPFDAPFV